MIASNNGWGGSSALATDFSQVGAFALAPTSNDAAVETQPRAGQRTPSRSRTAMGSAASC